MNIQLRKFLHSQIFRSIKPQHFTPKSKFSSLSDNAVDNLNIPNEVLALINSARPIEPALTELSPLLNREVVISVLQSHGQLKMDPLICFRFFIWASEEARLRSRLSNKLMVDVLSSSGDVSSLDLCWSILDELRNEEKSISADVFAVLILGYWRLKKAEKAVETFGRMKDYECKPNLFSFNVILHVLVQKDVVLLALAVYNMMLKSNISMGCDTFNVLIDGLCKNGMTEAALNLFDEMTSRGKSPSLFLRLSQGADRILDIASLQKNVENMMESGLILKAYKLLKKLTDSGVVPNVQTYNTLIHGMCNAGHINIALKLLEELQLKGHSPDSVTYATLMNALQRVDRDGEAYKLFEQMNATRCKPSSSVYKTLMSWSFRKKKTSVAISFWLKYLKNRADVEHEEVLKSIEERFEKGDFEEAVRSLLEMDIKLADFDSALYSIWLTGMCKAKRPEVAVKTFYILEEFNVTVSAPACVLLIRTLCFKKEFDRAVDVFLYTMQKGYILGPQLCNRLIEALLKSKDKVILALELLDGMKSTGYDLNSHLYKRTKSLLPHIYSLQKAYAHGCWGLLPAFCRWPSDTCQSFSSLSELLIPFLKKDSYMLENIAIGLQELVNENRRALASNHGSVQSTEVQSMGSVNAAIDFETKHVYSRKMASKNIKALALGAKELLLPLTYVLFDSPPETRKHLQGAISCLVSICDPSVTKKIFIASLKKFQLLDDIGELEKLESDADVSGKEKEIVGTDAKRCLILDLASCIVEGSDDDLVNIFFSLIKHSLQASDMVGQMEAYQTLSKILEKHSGFCSTKFDAVMDLLTGMKPSANIELVKSRFACLQTLLIHALTRNLDEENTKAFLILNEIILTLKDSTEEGRKAAYDALHGISSKLRSSTDASSDELYQKLINMIIGYLSGPSPHIKSGVVSALSVLVYSDPNICVAMPDVFPSVMELLHSKAIEVIKAVLGFVKVLVSCLTPDDLHRYLSEIMDGILRWSSVSRNHFREKIIVILEILMRKCGCAKVKALAPEKYKDFVHGVAENRHGKANSKEAGNADTKPDVSETSSPRGQQKRKREDSAFSSKEEGSGRPWKKRDNRKNTGTSESTRPSDHVDLRKGKSNKPDANRFKRNISGGEKKRKGRSLFKSNERDLQRSSAAASRNPKHVKPVRKNR